MTLDELLALLPDNTTGQISAADMRTIVTELWDNTATLAGDAQIAAEAARDHAIAADARIDALEEAAGGDRTVSGLWRLDTAAGGDPGPGEVTTDTGALVGAAWLRFAAADRNGVDHSLLFPQVTKVAVQDKDAAANWAKWDVSGAVTDAFGDFMVPVTLVGNAGALVGGNNDLVFVLSYPGASA